MREVKFRAYSTTENRMFDWDEIKYDEYEHLNNYFDKTMSDVSPLMQFTGLHDKNGKEIYEGDVLLIQAEGYDPIVSEVVWGGKEYPAFDLPKYDGYGMNAFSAIHHNDVKETIKVIGNIYENPELYKEETK